MMRIRDRWINNESGAAFVLALIFLAVGALTITPILGLFSTELGSLNSAAKRLKELYAADSGAEHAMWMIENSSNLMPGYNNQPPPYAHSPPAINGNNVTYSIAFVDVAVYRVTSTATSAVGTNTTIETYVSVLEGGIFANAATSLDGDMKVGGTVSMLPLGGDADIYVNGDITGTGTVLGNASATGSISSSTTIAGNSTAYAAPRNFPPISTALYLDQANLGTLIDGNYNVSSSSSLGPAHITGNLKLSGGVTLTLLGTLWVDGTISVTGGSTIMGAYTIVSDSTNSNAISISGGTSVDLGSTPLFIATQGGVSVAGGSTVSAVIYAPNGLVSIQGSGTTVNGCVAGKSVDISGSVTYPSNLQQVLTLPGGTLPKVITWEIMQ